MFELYLKVTDKGKTDLTPCTAYQKHFAFFKVRLFMLHFNQCVFANVSEDIKNTFEEKKLIEY